MYTIRTFTTRGSTCPTRRHVLMRNGERTTTEFGNYREALHYCALRNLKEYTAANRIIIDMNEKELLAKIIVLDA